ncbi:MAG: hypothetical protein ABIJ21_08365 [Nanoarchaeota archaeon]
MTITIVYKESRYEIFQRCEDDGERQVMLQEVNGIGDMIRKHDAHYSSLEKVIATVKATGDPYQAIMRTDIATLQGSSLVIPVGGDGTFIDASHYILNGTPILGINSDPNESSGFFCYGQAKDLAYALAHLDTIPKTTVKRMQVELDGKVLETPALNDVLLRHIYLGSSWWTVQDNGDETLYKYPYMFMVATPAGTTAGMWGIEGDKLPLDSLLMEYRFVGLRGHPSHFTEKLEISSRTNRGVLQIDGYHIRYDVKYGTRITLSLDAPSLTVIGDLEEKRKQFY